MLTLLFQRVTRNQVQVRSRLARINLSPLFTKIQGPLGPWTFSSWRGVDVLKKKPEFSDEWSAGRYSVRSAYGRLVELWLSLLEPLKTIWDNQAYPLGLSGFNLFVKENLALELAGSFLTMVPPFYSTLIPTDFLSVIGTLSGEFDLTWTSPYSGPDYFADIYARFPGRNAFDILTVGTLQLDAEAYTSELSIYKCHFDEAVDSYLLSTRAKRIDRGTFSTTINLNNTVSTVGHNMNIFIPRGAVSDKGIEISLGNDISNIDIFFTGEKNEDWNTYYQQPIESLVTLGKDFNLICEWFFDPPNSVVNFYIDGVLVTGTTWDQLGNWDENFAPDTFCFGNEAAPLNDRILDGEMGSVHVFERWLTAPEKAVIGKFDDLRDEAYLCYLFEAGVLTDFSGNHNTATLHGNASVGKYAFTPPIQVFLQTSLTAPPGSPVQYSGTVACQGEAKP